MQGDETLQMIARAFRHHHAVCEIVLAVQRVELTSILSRIAGAGPELGDTELVSEVALRISEVARAADLDAIRKDALRLRDLAERTDTTQRRAEGPMLVAGLRLIDHILDASGGRAPARRDAAPTPTN